MEEFVLTALKLFLSVFAVLGIVFHLLVLRNPKRGMEIEQKLGTEFGVKKKFVPWLEKDRMGLHGRLIRSKGYNILAVIFLIIILTLLSRFQS